jgi:hypothetical protein
MMLSVVKRFAQRTALMTHTTAGQATTEPLDSMLRAPYGRGRLLGAECNGSK